MFFENNRMIGIHYQYQSKLKYGAPKRLIDAYFSLCYTKKRTCGSISHNIQLEEAFIK